MCGFRPFREFRGFVQTVPELQRILGPELVQQVVVCRTDSKLLFILFIFIIYFIYFSFGLFFFCMYVCVFNYCEHEQRATTSDEEKAALKQAFRTLLLHPKDNCAKEMSALCNRLINEHRTDVYVFFVDVFIFVIVGIGDDDICISCVSICLYI